MAGQNQYKGIRLIFSELKGYKKLSFKSLIKLRNLNTQL